MSTMLAIEQVSQFLYREARLLDQSRYTEWLNLWAPDAEYWVPCNNGDNDPLKHIAIAYLDRKGLEGRVMRLNSGQAYSQDPPSLMSRIVANIEVREGALDDSLDVHANFNLTELRRHEQHTFAGRYEYTLIAHDDSWLITRKKATLINADEPIANLSFFL
jgi:benzoate/toluate 1,2-dioxygenase beta subunit